MKFHRCLPVAVFCAILCALCGCVGGGPPPPVVGTEYFVSSPQFAWTMGNLLGPMLVPGNRVQAFQNGDEVFPTMLDAIHSAQKTITFETFIYWKGFAGAFFADALSDRARAGVKVHVLIDAVGGLGIDKRFLKEMTDAGVEIHFYHPLHWYQLSGVRNINNRTHRKILVIDGRVGFTGGVNIADEWLGHAQDPEHWRDTHFRVEGPVVATLQAAFMDTWIHTDGVVLHSEDYFPLLQPVGDQLCQVFTSTAAGGSDSMELMYLLSFAAAQESIVMETAYFIPDDLTIEALLAARRRNVRVMLITTGPHVDYNIARLASKDRWGKLLEAGVEIYEYQPTMFHCKMLIVDGLWVCIGSANLDNRSFRLNDEANLNVLDSGFAATQRAIFDEDLKHATRYSVEQWRQRPWHKRMLQSMASWFGSEL